VKRKGEQFPVLYHGTHVEHGAASIRETGMRPVPGHIINPVLWPTLSTDRGQAERYGKHVVEVHLNHDQVGEYLHPEQEHTAYGFQAKAYAVKKHIPPEHIR
jgi:hypothetical protein